MNLRDMVKSYSADAATATVATVATPTVQNAANVAEVAGVAVAKTKNENLLLAERWQWFLSLAAEHRIHPDVAAAEFPAKQDKWDVTEPAEHTDDVLRACMKTLCANVRVQQRQESFERGEWVPVKYAEVV